MPQGACSRETKSLNALNSLGGGDYWDRDIGRYEGVLYGDVNQSLGTGATKLRSTGNFKATRKGNLVHIDGVVEHGIKDIYDFNADDPEFSSFKRKADIGKAKPFLIYGSKWEQLTGDIVLENSKVKKHNLKWSNVRK